MIFNASQIIGKTLFSLVSLAVYSLPDTSSPQLRTVPANSRVGQVDSYIMRGNDLFWMLTEGGYVLHAPGTFSTKALADQGAIDEATLNKPEISLKERLMAALGISFKTLSIALPLILIAIAAYFILLNYKLYKK